MTAETANTADATGALLLVAAKSLQGYVLGSDKLREMVGATQLIEDFCSANRAKEYLAALGLADGEGITGAAGQITIRFNHEESARHAAALWPWFAHRLAPGLEVHSGIASMGRGYLEALDECQAQIARSRNRPPASLPAAAPIHLRNPRSGKAATGTDREPDRNVVVDAEGHAKRQRREQIRKNTKSSAIFKTFHLLDEENGGRDFIPESFEEITEGGPQEDRTYLAVVHADGNGFGKMLMTLGKETREWPAGESINLFQKLSEAIRILGESAAATAIKGVDDRVAREWQDLLAQGKKPPSKKPWIPIVQAGDDLTLVIRADLAFDFLKSYLAAFEAASLDKLGGFASAHFGLSIPEKFTAGGAIVYCKTQHPFSEAYALCESLAKARAKGQAVYCPDDKPRSALAFHRISASTSHTEFSELRRSELLCHDGNQPELELIAAPWFLDGSAGAFTIAHLEALTKALRAFPAGSRRQILSELRTSRDEANARLRRMIEVKHRDESDSSKKQIAALESALAAVHGSEGALWIESPVPGNKSGKVRLMSAIPDALTLLEVTRESSAD